jgi:uncharacterized low-complexity protein
MIYRAALLAGALSAYTAVGAGAQVNETAGAARVAPSIAQAQTPATTAPGASGESKSQGGEAANDPARADRGGAQGQAPGAKPGTERSGRWRDQATIDDPARPDRMGPEDRIGSDERWERRGRWSWNERQDEGWRDGRRSDRGRGPDISPAEAARIAIDRGLDDVDDVSFRRGVYVVDGYDSRGYRMMVRIDRDGDVIDIDRE